YFAKPSLPTSRTYGPTGRLVMTKLPSAALGTVRTNPVPVCVALISAPGTASPVVSCTVPLIWEVEIACDQPSAQVIRQTAAPNVRFRIQAPSRETIGG